ncbi:MAG: response regulator [Caldilineaceae bacterium]
MNDRPIRVLIVDDHPVFRFGMNALIEAQKDMVVVGEAGTTETGVALATQLRPDVVLMDITMPDGNGIDATRRILQLAPEIAVLIVTMLDDDTVLDAMQAGARGYLIKGAKGDETLRAIRAAANGELILSSGAADLMAAYLASGLPPSLDSPFPELTPRETEILDYIAQGLTNSAIAEKLVLSPKTVRNHISNIFGKLQVANRNEAIVKAREAGLGRRR